MADLVGCVKDIGKCILTQCIQPPVKRHFDYWWCFHNNIERLGNEVGHLDQQIYDFKQKIEDARLRTEILRAGVVERLNLASEKLAEGRRILQDDNIPKAWNITSRYSMGKRAKKTAEEIAKLRNDGNFNTIADPAPPPAMGSPFHSQTVEFESRKSIEKNIIDSLKQSSVDVIGIFGMGGVGKTTMAQRIGKRVKEENLFDEVVTVTVSQTINMPKIQNEIADLLKLKFDESSMAARAYQLRTRLMDAKRKIIIFDDVWESLKFEGLGIPIESNFERCKVLVTSRSRDTCKQFKNKVVFDLKILEEEEAWILFKEKAGKCVEDSNLHRVVKDVVKECKGLPIALVTVGLALQDETSIYKWEDSLSQLRKANPEDFSEVSREVYNPLKLSYDFLYSDRERSLFLLCCLFPEDFDISVEQLTRYSMGLGLFHGVNNIKEARNRTHTLVRKLESRFLLIDVVNMGRKGLEVKMHDVIRDVAIYIGSIEKDGFLKSLTSIENSSDVNCNWMSVDISNEQMEVPVLSRFPKLRLLLLSSSNDFHDISHISFEGTKELNVLSFEDISIASLPPTLGLLKNLQTLRLVNCTVENISVIGELTSLKIFCCSRCENITELPAEIGRLKGLRLLELYYCPHLQTIPFGIISSLSLLEELKIFRSFTEWETRGEGRNASLTELERLRNLTCLEIQIPDFTSSAQEIRLSQKLVRYRIFIGVKDYDDFEYLYREKVMILKLAGAVGNWIQLLARNAEHLGLSGDGADNINLAEMENLSILNFSECSTVKKFQNVSLCNLNYIYISWCNNLRSLFSVSVARRCLSELIVLRIEDCESMEQVFWNEVRDDNTDGCVEFPELKELILENLPNLTAFCQGLENIIIKFPNLSQMSIAGLPKMNSLLFCNPKDLLQLHDLSIEDCESMEQVFWNEIKDNNTDGCIEFPELMFLTLLNLPNLTAFCQGLENIIIKFPNLILLRIEGLSKLNSLLFCNQKDVSFSNLKSIIIVRCCNLRSLFSVSASRTRLPQLELLLIKDCESMEEVFWNEIKDNNTDGCIEFPKLKELGLLNLPNLTAFCQPLENIIINFPNLIQLDIGGLPNLNSLCPLNSETVENSCFHLFCNPKVEMVSLEVLTLNGSEDTNIRNIWCSQIPNNFFNNLVTLHIKLMNGIRSLMSTSIAKNLVSLKYLTIHNCRHMVEVIERDDDDNQVVDIQCLFFNLKSLEIRSMPKLRRFWQWNHALELPLLEQVDIIDCRVMETFTLGSINTPNIRMINVNNNQIDDQKDLNDVIHHIWSESQYKFEIEEDMGEGEDESRQIRN